MGRINDQDIKNLTEIREFLEENEIEFHSEYDTFAFGKIEDYIDNTKPRTYEIKYEPWHTCIVKHDKFGILGRDPSYCFDISYQAEHENNSFICWCKSWEWEDPRKREVLKSYWLYAAGKIKNNFYARDCEVREVNSKDARAFEAVNCFYGKRGASLNLGLYTKKEKHGIPAGTLIMLYTFGLNFFGKDRSIEVLRVGTLLRCNVAGGASKLLNYFIRNYPTLKVGKTEAPVEVIKFYSDYCHNLGSSMEKVGFEFVGYSKGGFMNYWLEENVVKHRAPHKHKEVMKEMEKGNVYSVCLSGVKTFKLVVTDEIRARLGAPNKKSNDLSGFIVE